MQGVMDVAAAASTNDQFRVTVRSGAVDIPSLLEQVKEKLNRNVELVTRAARKDAGGGRWDDVKVDNYKGAAEDGGDKQKHCRYASGGDEIKKEKAAANNTGMNHAPTSPYAYLPFAVALVPIATDGSKYQAPSLPYSFLPYTQDPPRNAQPYQHRVPSPAKKYDGGGDRKDIGANDDDRKTEKVAADRGSDKKEPEPTGGGETKDSDKTAVAAGAGNVTIGVPVRTVSARMHELVPPPPYGHWPYAQSTGGCYHDGAGAPSEAAAYYHHYYSPYPYMFSDENPNACSII